jgi:RNA polymerase sigma factor (sigma-70 family)
MAGRPGGVTGAAARLQVVAHDRPVCTLSVPPPSQIIPGRCCLRPVPPASDLYTEHAGTIEAALTHACRCHRLSADAADEFRSWARLRLIDNDQAVLRKFEGRSSLRTFLVTVVNRLYLDWRNAEWGKWRPTAEARRLGPVAIELERLVLRDGLTVAEATSTLIAQGRATGDECDRVWPRLPRRPRRRHVGEQELAALPSSGLASDALDDDESRAEAAVVAEALEHAMWGLPPGDQVLLQLRYWSGLTVARVAVLTAEEPKTLYRRYERLTAQLRRSLEAAGVTATTAATMFGRQPDVASRPVGRAAAGIRRPGPSEVVSTGGKHG